MSEKKNETTRVPLWLATSFAVIAALIPAFFFGNYVFTAWMGFFVWAEYFQTDQGRPCNWKTITPCLFAGSANGMLYIMLSVFLSGFFGQIFGEGTAVIYGAWVVSTLITTPCLICPMQKSKLLMKGSLSYFNGYAMVFASYFTAPYPKIGSLSNPYWSVILSFLWVNLMGQYGWLIGYLNVKLTFPKRITAAEV
jgi:hypothetical protein